MDARSVTEGLLTQCDKERRQTGQRVKALEDDIAAAQRSMAQHSIESQTGEKELMQLRSRAEQTKRVSEELARQIAERAKRSQLSYYYL